MGFATEDHCPFFSRVAVVEISRFIGSVISPRGRTDDYRCNFCEEKFVDRNLKLRKLTRNAKVVASVRNAEDDGTGTVRECGLRRSSSCVIQAETQHRITSAQQRAPSFSLSSSKYMHIKKFRQFWRRCGNPIAFDPHNASLV